MRMETLWHRWTALLSLLAVAAAPAAGEGGVTAAVETLTLPWHTSTYNWQENANHPKPLYPTKDSKKLEGDRDLKAVVLENEYLKVWVLPEVGGVVARAIDKSTGRDLFFWEGKAKDWLPWWESGVKVSFPYYEHGLGMTQPTGWAIVNTPSGGKAIAMFMEFSRFNEPWQRRRYGRYSDMTLTQVVALEPRTGWFSVRYRIHNPSAWRQGRRLWNDTLLPRNETAEGVVQSDSKPPETTQTEWVFPTAYWSDHGGNAFGKYDPAMGRIGSRTGGSYSVFAWDIPFGFAGLYYPQTDTNRLRLFDPKKAPGAKQWYIGERPFDPDKPNAHMYNFCELWGGTDSVFEGIEHWIGPGEAYEFTYRYTLLKGIGKAEYADETLALNLDTSTQPTALRVLTMKPTEALTVKLDGKTLATIAAGPDTPAAVKLPAGVQGGTFTLAIDGKTVFDRRLPLEIPAETAKHAGINEALKGKCNAEMRGNADEAGNTYQKAIRQYPEGSTDRGRVLLRDGQVDEAVKTLTQATAEAPGDGEAWHLLGAALLEKGQTKEAAEALQRAVTADRPDPAAGYERAVLQIAAGKADEAARTLGQLTTKQPTHWQARLLHAWLLADAKASGALAAARALVAEDPADPRAWWVLRQAGGDAKALDDLLKEPGAKARLDEFIAATKGKIVPAERIK